MGLSGKNLPDKGDSKCKGPEDPLCSTCVISNQEARGAEGRVVRNGAGERARSLASHDECDDFLGLP